MKLRERKSNRPRQIQFEKYQEENWNDLYDINGDQLQQLQVHVVADKGFNYSNTDNCFVNQKNNHFQVSVHVKAPDSMAPRFVSYNNQLIPIRDYKLSFCGVKAEMPISEVTIRQSRADREPHPHTPVLFEIQERRMTKVTVPRLHFSETTLNNQRKNFRPNPEQKYFLLVVRLYASIGDENNILIQSYSSEKVIVRATNPGSFEPPDADVAWQRAGNTLFTPGSVARAIQFEKYQEESWNDLYDVFGDQIQQLQVDVVADKGFNYSSTDNCFVNQKNNHFQVSVHVEAPDSMLPRFVSYNHGLFPIRHFDLSLCGVKVEMPTSEIPINQSLSDRKPHPHTPVLFEIQERRMTKITVPRLHFSKTTSKSPEQKYFLFVVRLYANVGDGKNILIQSFSSEKFIVRTTNR